MLSRYSSAMARAADPAPSPFVREAAFVADVGRLSDRDIARATGAAASTVRAWLARSRTPTGKRAERLVELSAVVERLARVVDPTYIAVWLRKPGAGAKSNWARTQLTGSGGRSSTKLG